MQAALHAAVVIAALIYVLFVPGFMLSFVFLKRGTVDVIERIALSFALSIAVVPILTFYFNLMGVKISRGSVLLLVLIITLASFGAALLLKRFEVDEKATARH